jgi:hypothetical protein
MEAQALKDDDIKLSIEAALARRHEKFAISYLSWTAHGYTLKTRQSTMAIRSRLEVAFHRAPLGDANRRTGLLASGITATRNAGEPR